ncbi:MAG TPA: extensin family protein [Kofleriaceae bacterium]|jgi:hypothetical protein
MSRWAVVAMAITLAWAAPAPAEAARRYHHRPNMPDGWKWPPTREMRREGKKCLAELRAMGVFFKKSPRKKKVTTPIEVPEMRFGPLFLSPTFRKPPFMMDCRLARGFAQYAELISALGVVELRFSTIYQYRKVRTRRGGGGKGALSRHSLGLAMDVFEIKMASGEKLVVKDDYWFNPTLMKIELALRATGAFRAILTPSVDPVSHRDHFHFEIAVEYPEEARKEAERLEKLRLKRVQAKRRKMRAERKRLKAERRKRKKLGTQAAAAGETTPDAAAAESDEPAADEPAAAPPGADDEEGPEDETTSP